MNTTVKILEDHVLVTVTHIGKIDIGIKSLLEEIFSEWTFSVESILVKPTIEVEEISPAEWEIDYKTIYKIKKYSVVYRNIHKTLEYVIERLNRYGFNPTLVP